MKELLSKVREFHEKFEIPLNDKFCLISPEEFKLRFYLMEEENLEYLQACLDGDKVEIADALGDKLYILLGTILQHGLQDKIVEVFNLIHQNNLNKLHDGKIVRDENGKVKKPDNFVPVDLTSVIND